MGLTLVGYVVVALVVLGLSGWLRRLLALPPLFETLVRGTVVLALPIAVAFAWKYPELGNAGRGDGARRPRGDSRPEE